MVRRIVPPFYLAVISEDAKVYCIKGPMTDDTAESNQIGQMAGDGYSIRCFTCGDGSKESGRLAVQGMFPDFKEVSYLEVIEAARVAKSSK